MALWRGAEEGARQFKLDYSAHRVPAVDTAEDDGGGRRPSSAQLMRQCPLPWPRPPEVLLNENRSENKKREALHLWARHGQQSSAVRHPPGPPREARGYLRFPGGTASQNRQAEPVPRASWLTRVLCRERGGESRRGRLCVHRHGRSRFPAGLRGPGLVGAVPLRWVLASWRLWHRPQWRSVCWAA